MKIKKNHDGSEELEGTPEELAEFEKKKKSEVRIEDVQKVPAKKILLTEEMLIPSIPEWAKELMEPVTVIWNRPKITSP